MNSTGQVATFRIDPELKERVEALAKKSHRSASYLYNQMARQSIEDLEDLYECMAIMERVHNGEERTYTAEEVKKELGLE